MKEILSLNVKNCVNKSTKKEAKCFVYTVELKAVIEEFTKTVNIQHIVLTAPENSIIVVEKMGTFIRSEDQFLEQYEYVIEKLEEKK